MTNAEAKTKLVKMGYDAEGLEKNKDKFLPEIYAWLVEIVGTPVKIERAEIKTNK
jgi:hypothetical protein